MNKKAILGSIFLIAGLTQPVLAQEINSEEDFWTWYTSNSIVPLQGDDSGFVFQIQTGVEFEISNKLSLLLQS